MKEIDTSMLLEGENAEDVFRKEITEQFVDSATAQIKENPSENMRDYLDTLNDMQEIVNHINFNELGSDRIAKECMEDINNKGIVDIGKNENGDYRISTLEMNYTATVQPLEFEEMFENLCDNIQEKLGNDASYKVACQYAETLVEHDSEYENLARILP